MKKEKQEKTMRYIEERPKYRDRVREINRKSKKARDKKKKRGQK